MSKKRDFYKMQGTGNDFVMVDDRGDTFPTGVDHLRNICDRRRGIGGDGVILLKEGEEEPFRMEMYNPDGSRAEMCGNGIRCLARLINDLGGVDRRSFSIETDAGVKNVTLTDHSDDAGAPWVRVDMGVPGTDRSDVPMNGPEGQVIEEELEAAGRSFTITAVSMGNPHCVIFVDDASSVPLEEWGSEIEYHDAFPERTNVEFVEVLEPNKLRQRTWERGAGETEACGTGACGVTVASILTGRAESPMSIHLDGGTLKTEWEGEGRSVFMEGPAEYCFEGTWTLPEDIQ